MPNHVIHQHDCVCLHAVNPGIVDMSVAFDKISIHPISMRKRPLNFQPSEVITLTDEIQEVANDL